MNFWGIRKAPIWLIVVFSVIALTVTVGAIAAGFVESGKTTLGKTASTEDDKQSSSSTIHPIRPTSTPRATERLRPTTKARPTAETVPTVAVPTSTIIPGEREPVAPKVVQTVQASPAFTQPSGQHPTPSATVCPSGVVTSGLTDITVTNERAINVFTLVDIVGHGAISNDTTAPIDVYISSPSVKGLDVDGRVSTYLDTEFDWRPAPGEPRPAQVTIQPGQMLTYTVAEQGLSSSTLRKTTAWYVDPNDSVDRYSDFDTYANCPRVSVVAVPGGPSIMNSYVPRGQ